MYEPREPNKLRRILAPFLIVLFFGSIGAGMLFGEPKIKPWLALVGLVLVALMFQANGKLLGIPRLTAWLMYPLLIVDIVLLFWKEKVLQLTGNLEGVSPGVKALFSGGGGSFSLFKELPGKVAALPMIWVYLALCVLLALILILGFLYERKVGRAGVHSKSPVITRLFSIIGLAIKYVLLSVLYTFAFTLLWNKFAPSMGAVVLPGLQLKGLNWDSLAATNGFWQVGMGVVLLIGILDIIRSLRGRMWDVFISYKSRNVELARAIADRLIASGLRVWFAEYQILLVERSKFQAAIDKGIRQSKYGIALTNDEYAGSEFCEKEMVQLLKHCGPEKIFEIMIPEEPLTHQKYSQLSKATRILYRGDLEPVLQELVEKTGWKILAGLKRNDTFTPSTFTGECLGDSYTLDVTGWDKVTDSFHGGGPCYSCKFEFRPIFWNLQYGEELSPEVYESRFSLDKKNDRTLYNFMVDYARHYFSDYHSNWSITGVHLFFLKGSSHFSVTYTDRLLWKRRYSIMLLQQRTGRAAEFLFTFEYAGSFKQYCQVTQIMDDLVKSLQWGEEPGSSSSPQPVAVIQPSTQEDRISKLIEDQPMAHKLYEDGLTLAKKGKLQEAIDTWKKVLNYAAVAELRGATLFNLGRAYEKLGDEDAAISSYKESVAANPLQFNALCNIGSILINRGQYQEALENLLKAAEINPQDELTVNNLVICYESLGEYEKAREWRQRG